MPRQSSDYVSVNNYGDVLNANGDGIDAELTAVAVATVAQEATQSNSASQSGTTTAAPSSVSLSQNLNQANFNDQEGIAIALASADDVKVTSQGFVDPPGDGIHAELSAVAVATVDQKATQSNSSTQTINQSGCGDCFGSNEVKSKQQNQSDQDGLAVAVGTSGEVTVQQHGVVSAAEDGIDAELNAVAVATVQQEVSQSSTIFQSITQTSPEPLALEQPVLENEQEAAAIAVALSDEVSVRQSGRVSAGADGVKGISSAVAVAKVEQTADQPIEQRASAAAVAVSDEVDVTVTNVRAGDDGVVGVSSALAFAEGGSSPLDMAAVAERYQGEYVDQWTLPLNLDTLAVAVADEVNVTTYGDVIAGGNGIVAVSFAKAQAEGDNAAAIAVSDDVNVVVNGDVNARKTGIFAASLADADAGGGFEFEQQGDVTVTVNKGKVNGGSGYYGIAVLGGDQNVITIGKKAIVTSRSKDAIFGGDQDETVENYGLVDGNVDLGLGNSAFNNYASASFYSGAIINLNGGLLFNAGLLSPGGPGVIQTSELNGSLLQTSSGRYAVDVDMGKADFRLRSCHRYSGSGWQGPAEHHCQPHHRRAGGDHPHG